MSRKQHHVILRSRIQVTIDSHNQYKAILDKLHKAIQKRILPILSKLFSEYVPSDALIHLDKLVIDGGIVHLATLSKQLPNQFEQVLTVKLKETLNKVINNPTAQQVIPLLHAKQEAIAHYLSEGNFAWWMVERSEKQIEQIYLALLEQKPILIEQLWANLIKKEKAVQRCIAFFSRATLEKTLACLLKQPVAYFSSILAETGLILHQTGILRNMSYTPQKQLLGMGLLGSINQERCKVDRITFLNMLFKQVAIQTSISYEKILETLHNYYVDNKKKYLSDQTNKALVLQLRDLVVIPPIFGCQNTQNQENVLKKLDQIANSRMDAYQLSAAIQYIKIVIDKPGIRSLVKSWLNEKKNREKLVSTLSNSFLVSFFRSVSPQVKSRITPLFTSSTNTLLEKVEHKTIPKSGMIEPISFSEKKGLISNHIVPIIDLIKESLGQRVSLSNEFLEQLEKVINKLLQVDTSEVNIDLIKNIFITAAIVDRPATEKEYIKHIIEYLKVYKPFASNILSDQLPGSSTLEPLDLLQIKSCTSSLKKVNGSVNNNSLSDVVNFLLYNELPQAQLVPAYLIANRLEKATLKEIRDELTPWCQEEAILKKLMHHTTEATLSKLLQAFIPFSMQTLDRLEKIIIESNLLQSQEHQANIFLKKEIFITASVIDGPPTTEKQYIARVLLHLSRLVSSSPTILCSQLIDGAKQIKDYYLVEVFGFLKEHLGSLKLDKIDELDLIFLSIHEQVPVDKLVVPLYYGKLLPAIKTMVSASNKGDLSQSTIHQLVTHHLPTISKSLKKTISVMITKQINTSIQSTKERISKRWHLFLHTGNLGNYLDESALFNDVIKYLPTFSLAQHKTHVRQRLIAQFSHSQLMLLVKKHGDLNESFTNYIEGSYQLWCATQGALIEENNTKNLFWNSLLKILSKRSIPIDDCLAQMITSLSNVLNIPPTTLVQTFQLLIEDINGIPSSEQLSKLLNNLGKKYQQKIEKEVIKSGYEEPLLHKLYLLLNGNLSLFSQKYDISTHTLGNELLQFMTNQPSELLRFLKQQSNDPLVARRMVHYFNQEVTTKIITFLAEENAPFVSNYLGLLSDPLQGTTGKRNNVSTWQKELYISIIDYFIRLKSLFKKKEFVYGTLVTISYPKEDKCKIIASILRKKPATEETDKIIALLKPLINRIYKPTNSLSTLVNNPLETFLPVTLQKTPLKKSSLPEEAIRVYTKNTGLVFLYPFLYDYFKSHDLMYGNQFFCDQAAHNAVYLLQYLVTGKLKSPEWQLTLPKLLCGLSYDEVLLPYRTIDEASDSYDGIKKKIGTRSFESVKEGEYEITETIEKEKSKERKIIEGIIRNSHLLFERVIKRWESLKDLKKPSSYKQGTIQDILQYYFLNRLGILTRHYTHDRTEKQFWHLIMIHQDHDKVDLLPPWSMNKLKLPWMQEEIVLFSMGQ